MALRRLLPCLLLAAAAPGWARAAESATEARLRDALRTATAQAQAAENARAQLQAADAAQKKELAELRAKLAAGTRNPRLDRELADATKKLQDEVERSASAARDLEQCRRDSARTSDDVLAKEQQRAELAGKLQGLNDRVSACEGKNARLYAVAKELLTALEQLGFGTRVGVKEPFLGLKRVELQNMAQDFQDRVSEQQVVP